MGEFELIERYFKRLSDSPASFPVDLGIGDDCALVSVPAGKQLAISSDTLVEGVHFPVNTTAADVGFKALGVNLSDLAAMGAEPAWFSLCLTLSHQNEQWIEAFCGGLGDLIGQIPIALIGGDTTRGDQLAISIQVMGLVNQGAALTRSGAQLGDDIYVSGTIGEAALGLRCVLAESDFARQSNAPLSSAPLLHTRWLNTALQRLNRPLPRNGLSAMLASFANACIDVSDGLLADLHHVLTRSNQSALLDLSQVPLPSVLAGADLAPAIVDTLNTLHLPTHKEQLRLWALSAGDDYELCFTASPQHRNAIEALSVQQQLPITRFGQVIANEGNGTELYNANPPNTIIQPKGFQHFN